MAVDTDDLIAFEPDKCFLKLRSVYFKHIQQVFTSSEFETFQMIIEKHFRAFDTICSATQDRQDAIVELLETAPDLTLVIGGFNSSNTINLNNIASQYGSSYHITNAECIIDENSIQHKSNAGSETITTNNWLPQTELTVAITAGASTPNSVTSEVIKRVLELRQKL